jgi:hypothetical protein
MTFVYEPLDENAAAELRAKVSKFQTVLSMTLAQIVDRGRDIVFVGLGGRGDEPPQRGQPPNHYAILWKGVGVAFEGYHENSYVNGVVNMTITLTRLAIPQQVRGEFPGIQHAAEEALALYWSTLNRRPTIVATRFPAPVFR